MNLKDLKLLTLYLCSINMADIKSEEVIDWIIKIVPSVLVSSYTLYKFIRDYRKDKKDKYPW